MYTNLVNYDTVPASPAGLAIENRLKLLAPLGDFSSILKPKIYLTPQEKSTGSALLAQYHIDAHKPLVMISMLGSSEKKTYPLPYLAQLIDVIVSQKEVQLLLNYLPDQKHQVEELLDYCKPETRKHIFEKIYAPDLRGFIALVAHCNAVMGNEGGAINMAKALNIPTFAIFSPQINRSDWDIFGGSQNMAVHLNDFRPELFEHKDKERLFKEAGELYKIFKPELIKSKLADFLVHNVKKNKSAP